MKIGEERQQNFPTPIHNHKKTPRQNYTVVLLCDSLKVGVVFKASKKQWEGGGESKKLILLDVNTQ